MVSRVIPVDPFDLVIFGGTGDLARRKILPGLFRRFAQGRCRTMPRDHRRGAQRDGRATATARWWPRRSREFGGGAACEDGTLDAFLERLDYVADRRARRRRLEGTAGADGGLGPGRGLLFLGGARRCSAIWRSGLHKHGMAR